jgi:hypothetical protein
VCERLVARRRGARARRSVKVNPNPDPNPNQRVCVFITVVPNTRSCGAWGEEFIIELDRVCPSQRKIIIFNLPGYK